MENAQQQRVRQRFPAGSPWLFPRPSTNLDGSLPINDTQFRDHLDRWLRTLRLVDAHGDLVRVTPHQFRHTMATRLINADVPQHVVQRLLDHMSPQMTAVYARLHQQTLRRHWEKAVKLNGGGQPAAIPSDHPLAGAAWTRQAVLRAKVSLPNGYCGAPIHTDCEHTNPCLDCHFMITTVEFLDHHRHHRDQTAALAADAEKAGLLRIAEKNRHTLTKLDTIIQALERTQHGQILAGGTLEDTHAPL